MKRLHLQFILRAETPISQHAGVDNNTAYLQTSKVRQPSGAFVPVPEVTANAIRHQLREIGALLNLQQAGLLGDGKTPELREEALRLLFNGGMLTGKGDSSVIRLENWRSMTGALPIIAIMGGCMDAMIVPGQLSVRNARLICAETVHCMPAWVLEHPEIAGKEVHSWRAQIEEQQRVRFDPTRDPQKRRLLSDSERAKVEQRLLGKEAARAKGEHADEDRGRPMPFSFEQVAEGSLWFWEVDATVYTDVEEALLLTMLAIWTVSGHAGGKVGHGNGKLRAVAAVGVPVPFWSPGLEHADLQALAGSRAQVLSDHFARVSEQVRDLLAKVDA